MVKQLLITGYYNKQNTGDDMFYIIAEKLFINNKKYKTTIKSIDDINNINNVICDAIVLFGGETLNEYFLEPISKLKEKNQNIKIYAFGVNIGEDIDYIKHYLIMFQYIIVRNQNDYNKIMNKFNNLVPCYYVQDIVFSNYIKAYKMKTVENCIGLFLSQPKNRKISYIDEYINIINYYVKNNYVVKLFSMCYSDNINESDKILNNNIYNKLSNEVKKNVKIIHDYCFWKHIRTLKYAICERFHAHIISIIYNIPFISFANTGKVKDLLQDLSLEHININIISNYDPEYINNKLKSINTKKLKKYIKMFILKFSNFMIY